MQLQSRVIGPGETFHLFKHLPTELRYMIWQFSLHPRVVDMEVVDTYDEDMSGIEQPDDGSAEAQNRMSLRHERIETRRSQEFRRWVYYYDNEDFPLLIRYQAHAHTLLPTALYACRDS
ncbi:uncharacterized protein LY89DRAFT_737053 [Mollisia scopiformis]|uniref:2EXR domain-containing protein n=1 Tax=Mollisia scopiformis TaxID=149040 RepID=A0A194X1I1_MOLSC|nr:uncharacterized protein LY89DRAFT_737053 [Mollisia scopiformis]KUJ14055.1 hypothetical protein LY89DRAFT_737053 [Mollisia scopiformis]